MRVWMSLLVIVALLTVGQALADKAMVGDGSRLELAVGVDGRGTLTDSFHADPATSEQRCLAVEGKVTWRDKPWFDLAFNASRVIYQVRLNRPVAKLALDFSFWGTAQTEGLVWASPDGKTWTQLWAYDPKTMSADAHVGGTVELAPYLARGADPTVYLKLGTQTKWGLLFGFTLQAHEKLPPVVTPYRPGPVPPDGALRYCIQYGDANGPFLEFLQQARVNFLHWHGPFFGYTGLPDRSKLEDMKIGARRTIDRVHAAGMACILYIGPCFSYGDQVKRTQLFDFYDNRWSQYEDYFGKKPGDLLEMAQCDPQGKPRPYVYGGQAGYHLCVNSPGVRQMTKGLIRMICEAGGDGSFYDGPYVDQGACYCRWCQAKFRTWLTATYSAADLRDHLGVTDVAAVTPPRSAKERLWVPWRRFNAWSVVDFMRDTRDYARTLNPHYIMTSNYCMWEGEPFSPIRGTAEDEEMQSQVIDLVFDEARYGGGPYLSGGVKLSNSTDYRHLLAGAHGKPVAALKTAPEGNNPEATANLTRLAMAEGAAQGGTYQLHRLRSPAEAAAIQYGAFFAARQEALTRCRPWAKIAIWSSSQQAYHDLSTYPTAVSRFLADNHVPHKFVIDEEVEQGRLGAYDVLIVPEVQVISDKQAAALEAYARSGQALILLGQCGAKNEWGETRAMPPFDRLAEPVTAGQWRWAKVGRGFIFYMRSVSLPRVPNGGLSAVEREGLAPLLPCVQAATRRPLPAFAGVDDKVELTTAYDGRSLMLAHLVNYAVELSGQVTPQTDLPLKLRLPTGTTVAGATLFTPDGLTSAKPLVLPFRVVASGPDRFVSLLVPRLQIYDQLELKLKLTPTLSQSLPQLLAGIHGEAAPGASLPLLVGLSGTDAPATYNLTLPSGYRATPAPDTNGMRTYNLQVPADAPLGWQRLGVSAQLKGKGILTDEVWFKVSAPLALSLHAPPYVDTRSGRTRVELRLDNRLDRALTAQVRLIVPEGWSVGNAPGTVNLAPKSDTPLAVWVRTPTDLKPAGYEVRGEAVAGSVRLTAAAGLSVIDRAKLLPCAAVAAPPKIDGLLDEPCWQSAPGVTSFLRTDGKGPAGQQTRVRLGHDSKNLYLAFECLESEPATIVSLVEQEGGEVWRDDSVEVFLDAALTRRDLRHYVANVAGHKYPAGGWTAATRRTATGWTVEMALPLGGSLAAGDMLGLNLCRTRPSRPQAEPEYSSWSFTDGGFHRPEKFGVMVLE